MHRFTGVFFAVLLLSVGIFYLVSPAYTGFVALTAQDPDNVTLFLDQTIYEEGDHITGTVDVAVSGPLDEQTLFRGKVDTQQEQMTLIQAFNLSNIPFSTSPREMEVQGGTSSRTLVYPHAGQQLVFP